MNAAIEKVARAICKANCRVEPHPCDRDDDGSCKPPACFAWRLEFGTARAAIEAMREPTEPMLKAATKLDCTAPYDPTMRELYASMIDEALRT
jgi:hypothetical protein